MSEPKRKLLKIFFIVVSTVVGIYLSYLNSGLFEVKKPDVTPMTSETNTSQSFKDLASSFDFYCVAGIFLAGRAGSLFELVKGIDFCSGEPLTSEETVYASFDLALGFPHGMRYFAKSFAFSLTGINTLASAVGKKAVFLLDYSYDNFYLGWQSFKDSIPFLGSKQLMAATLEHPPPQPTRILFITYDMGETNGFKPIFKVLAQKGLGYEVLALGKSSEALSSDPQFLQRLLPLPASIDRDSNLNWPRDKEFTASQLNEILLTLKNTRVVLSGVASLAQAQLLNALKPQGAKLNAFYDNFDDVSGKEYAKPFFNKIVYLETVLVPSHYALSGFKTLLEKKQIQQTQLLVMGQPSLEQWDQVYLDTNPTDLRARLNPENKPLFLWVGGMDTTYKEAFYLFLKTASAFPQALVFITPHPKTDGSLEKALINETKFARAKIFSGPEFSTAQLSTIADAVVCHQSTACVQALYKGRKVVYVTVEKNFATEQNFAKQVTSLEDGLRVFKTLLSSPQTEQQNLGFPSHSSEKIANFLESQL